VHVPTPNALPYGIAVNSDDIPFFAEFGTNKLASVDPKTMEIHEYETKKPSESKGEWDYFKLVATIPAEQAFRPLSANPQRSAQAPRNTLLTLSGV
jgi:hypothetical protein